MIGAFWKFFELFKDEEENFTLDKNCIKFKTGVNYNHLVPRSFLKVFELNFKDQEENFTLDKNCIKLKTGVNYNDLIPRAVGWVPTSLFYLQKAFDNLWRRAEGEKVDISEEVVIIAVHILEASKISTYSSVHMQILYKFVAKHTWKRSLQLQLCYQVQESFRYCWFSQQNWEEE